MVRVCLVCVRALFAVALAMSPLAPVAADSLLIVAPDVELTLREARPGAVVLPSAAQSDALAARWPAAAAAALGLGTRAEAWRPPADLRADDPIAQVLALQEAVAVALLEPDLRPRPASLGAGAARLGAATGATHALFARVRATPKRGSAVAMLVDLRTGDVLRHRVATGIDPAGAPAAAADRLARGLLAGWSGLPAPAKVPASSPAPVGQDDVGRAVARLTQRLRRHPRRLDDPALDAALRDVACRVDAAGCAAIAPILLDEPGAHAATYPDGTLVLHTGLLLRVGDEAELAFVLAHEMAHSRRGDARAQIDAGLAARRSDVARDREWAADREAFARLEAAGYDTGAAARLLARLQAEPVGDAGRGSHPTTAERLAAMRAAVDGSPRGDRGHARWEALAASRRQRWLATEIDAGSGTLRGMLAAAGGAPGGQDDDWARAIAAALQAHDRAGTAAVRPAPAATAPTPVTSPPRRNGAGVRVLRVLGLRLPSRLPWRQRPGIGAVAWTVDGTPLNRLQIVAGIVDGGSFLHDPAPGAPRWSRGSPAPATTAGIVATLRRGGWTDMHVDDLRSHDFGGVPGWRAELALADTGGLRYRGTLAHAVHRGRLTWAVWLAPAAVYHPRDAAEVAAMLDGMTFAR